MLRGVAKVMFGCGLAANGQGSKLTVCDRRWSWHERHSHYEDCAGVSKTTDISGLEQVCKLKIYGRNR